MEAACLASPPEPLTLYARDELQSLTGGPLRPGGLALTVELLRLADLPPGSTVLDIGCGPGHSLALMATDFGLGAVGVDPAAAMLKQAARKAPGAALLQGIATALPCAPAQFTAITCECVLSLSGDIDRALAEMHRVLIPGGRLLLTDIYCRKPEHGPQLPELNSCLAGALPLARITAALSRAGFSLLALHDRTPLLKQLAGQIIFNYGSLDAFWELFLDGEAARRTSCALATAPLGYFSLLAEKGALHG